MQLRTFRGVAVASTGLRFVATNWGFDSELRPVRIAADGEPQIETLFFLVKEADYE